MPCTGRRTAVFVDQTVARERIVTMARPRGLTTERIEALPHTGSRYEVPDGLTPNLFIRVGKLKKVFVLQTRIAGRLRPTRRKIGTFPATSLERAREVAAEWNAIIRMGLDPSEERNRMEREEKLRKRRTFRSAMEDYFVWLPNREFNRHVLEDIADLRREFLDPDRNAWLDTPMADVTEKMVKAVVTAIRDRPAHAAAFNSLNLIRGFFAWSFNEYAEEYGMAANPVAALTHKKLKLRTRTRGRSLDVLEFRAYFLAADELPYPWGPFFKLVVLLGGRRRTECAGMRWSEIDWSRRLWTIPAERVKHGEELLELRVPLTRAAIALLEELRRNQPEGWGDCVFSTTNGQIPINGFGKPMRALRAGVETHFQKLRPGVKMKGWVLHDMRRGVRTALSSLGVDGVVAELAIGHRKKRDYNQDSFRPQVRRALELFTARLMEVVDGTATDFVADDLREYD